MKAGLVCAIVLAVLECQAWAQTTGAIAGLVTDRTGGVLARVSMTARHGGTGLVRMTITNDAGLYVLPMLPVGSYELTAELPGFRPVVMTGVVLTVNQTLTVSLTLEVGVAPGYGPHNAVLGQPDRWFDPAAFVLQEAGTFGNTGRSDLIGPNAMRGRRRTLAVLAVLSLILSLGAVGRSGVRAQGEIRGRGAEPPNEQAQLRMAHRAGAHSSGLDHLGAADRLDRDELSAGRPAAALRAGKGADPAHLWRWPGTRANFTLRKDPGCARNDGTR